jgi:hypothetical protein
MPLSSAPPVLLLLSVGGTWATVQTGTTTVAGYVAGAVGDTSWQNGDLPPAPPAPPPPAMLRCAGVHVSEAIIDPTTGHASYHARLTLHVHTWLPGGQIALLWQPVWAAATITRIEGGRVLHSNEYGAAERGALAPYAGASVIELHRARHGPCTFSSEPTLNGDSCVYLEAKIDSDEQPNVAVRCAAGSNTAEGFMEAVSAHLDEMGCPMDEAPIDGFSTSDVERRDGSVEVRLMLRTWASDPMPHTPSDPTLIQVRLMLRTWASDGLVSLLWPRASGAVEILDVPTWRPSKDPRKADEIAPKQVWGATHLGTRVRPAGIEMLFQLSGCALTLTLTLTQPQP